MSAIRIGISMVIVYISIIEATDLHIDLEVNPEVDHEEYPEVYPKGDPEIYPEEDPEVYPDDVPEKVPGVYAEVDPEEEPETYPEEDPEVNPEVVPKKVPEVYPEVVPEEDPEFKFGDEDKDSCSNTLFREKRGLGGKNKKKKPSKSNRSANEIEPTAFEPEPPGHRGFKCKQTPLCVDASCCSTKKLERNRCIELKDVHQCITQGCNWCESDIHKCNTIYYHDIEPCQFNNVNQCCTVSQDVPVCKVKASSDCPDKPGYPEEPKNPCGKGICTVPNLPRNLTIKFHGRGDKILDIYFLLDFSVSTQMDQQRPRMAAYAEFLFKQYKDAGKDLRIGFGSFVDKEVVEARDHTRHRRVKNGGKKSSKPSGKKSSKPSGKKSSKPSGKKSSKPSGKNSSKPSGKKSSKPSGKKSSKPSGKKSSKPSGKNSSKPSGKKSNNPSGKKSSKPSGKRKGRSTDGQTTEVGNLTGTKGRIIYGPPAGAESQVENLGRASKGKPGKRTSNMDKTDDPKPAEGENGGPTPGSPSAAENNPWDQTGGVLPGHSFRNGFNLTTSFQNVFNEIKKYTKDGQSFGENGTNRYARESQLEAMSQIGLCSIRWRENATRIIVMMTDGGYHEADEDAEEQNVGENLKPFDSECHLDDQGSYTGMLTMKYPKVDDVYKIMTKSQINTLIVYFKTNKTEIPGFEIWKKDYEKDKAQWEGYVKNSKNRAKLFTWTNTDNEGLKKAMDAMYKQGMKEDSGSGTGYKISLSNNGEKLEDVDLKYFSKCDGDVVRQTDTCKVWPPNDILEFIVQYTLKSCKGGNPRPEYNTLFDVTGVSYHSTLKYAKVCTSNPATAEKRKRARINRKSHKQFVR